MENNIIEKEDLINSIKGLFKIGALLAAGSIIIRETMAEKGYDVYNPESYDHDKLLEEFIVEESGGMKDLMINLFEELGFPVDDDISKLMLECIFETITVDINEEIKSFKESEYEDISETEMTNA